MTSLGMLRRHGTSTFKVFVAFVFFFTMVNIMVQLHSCTYRDRESHLKLPSDPSFVAVRRDVLNAFRNENVIVNQDGKKGEEENANQRVGMGSKETHPKVLREETTLPKQDVKKADIDNRQDQVSRELEEKIDWNNYTFIAMEKKRKGAGEQGQPYVLALNDTEKVKVKLLYDATGYNAYLSDVISLDRAVPDIRHAECHHKLYLKKLPSVSVIIPFHNEHWSTLLRTVHSVINRSPPELLTEVILADDFSTKESLKGWLDDYVRTHFTKVRVSRPKEREGAIRTRNRGAREARGEVLIFLDSHVEANVNWLPPLLEPLVGKPRTVVCPFIDIIAHDTFATRPQDEGARGAFDWHLDYKRLPLLPEDRTQPTKPFRSPVLAGGLYAIHRSWWQDLGGMDPGLEIWGGEQYDLSFKIWLCGGEILDAPCSRFYHVYKGSWPSFNVGYDFLGKNYRRMAEAWMGEFAHYVYLQKPNIRAMDPGDISALRALQSRLQCKPFHWFMAQVAPDILQRYPPPGVALAQGQVRGSGELCWEASAERKALYLAHCSDSKQQKFLFSTLRELQFQGSALCVDVAAATDNEPLALAPCLAGGGNQRFRYNPETSQLLQPGNLCVKQTSSKSLVLGVCDANATDQKWHFQEVDQKKLAQAWAV